MARQSNTHVGKVDNPMTGTGIMGKTALKYDLVLSCGMTMLAAALIHGYAKNGAVCTL